MGKKKEPVYISSPSDFEVKQALNNIRQYQMAKMVEEFPSFDSKVEKVGEEEVLKLGKSRFQSDSLVSTATPYSKYDEGYTPGQSSLSQVRSDNQGFLAEAFNTIVEPILNAPFITGSYVTAGLLPEDFEDLEKAAAYSTYKWFKDHSDEIRENFPVYQNDNSGFQGAREYIMSTLQQVGESALPFVAIGAGVSAATSATFGAAGAIGLRMLSPAIRAIVASNRANNLVGTLRGVVGAVNTAKQLSGLGQTLTTAYALNRTESMIEAADNYSQIYEQNLSKYKEQALNLKRENDAEATLSLEEENELKERAKLDAQIGAKATNEFNRVNLLLNLTSASRFVKPIMRSRMAFKPKTIKDSMLAVLGETGQEAGEEIINLLAQNYGKAVSEGKDTGIFNYLGSKEALLSVLSSEGAHAAFAGALGGGVQTGITEAISRKGAKYQRALDNWTQTLSELDEFRQAKGNSSLSTAFAGIVDSSKIMEEFDKVLEEADRTGDYTKAKAMEKQILHLQAFNAFNNGAGLQIQEMYESLKDMEEAEAQSLGYDIDPESDQYYKTKANNAIKELAKLETLYNFSTEFKNYNSVYFNRAWDSYLNSALNESNDRLELSRVLATDRAEEIFGEGSNIDLDNLSEITDSQKLDQLKNSMLYKTYEQEKVNNNSVKNAIAKNNTRFDELLNPETQKKEEARQKQQEREKKEAAKRAEEEEKRRKAEEAKVIAKAKETTAKLKKLGYSDEDIASMDEATKSNTVKNKVAKTTPPASSSDGSGSVAQENPSEEEEESEEEEIPEEELPEEGGGTITSGTAVFGDAASTEEELEARQREEELEKEKVKATPKQKSGVAKKVYDGNLDKLTPLQKRIYEDYKDEIDAEVESMKTTEAETESIEAVVPQEELVRPQVTEDELKSIFDVLTKGTTDPSVEVDAKLIEYAHDAIAYRSRNFVTVRNNDGSVTVVKKVDVDDQLNENLFVDLLDPSKYNVGTKITLRPNPTYDGEVNDPRNPNQKIQWSELKAQLIPNSAQYIASVPIAIYNQNDELIGYVHDLTWLQNQENNLAASQEFDSTALMSLRQTVLQKGEHQTTIKSKSAGTLAKSAKGKGKVSERFPGLQVVVNTTSGIRSGGRIKDDVKILNEGNLKLGRTYVIVPLADGVSHIAMPVDTDRLSDSGFDSTVTNMIATFLAEMDTDVYKNLGVPFESFSDIRAYLSNFIYNVNFESKARSFEEYLQVLAKDPSVPKEKAFFNFTSNAIEFGNAGLYYGIFIDPKTNRIGVRKTGVKPQYFERGFESMQQGSLLYEALGALKASLSQKGFNISDRKFGQNIKVLTQKNGKFSVAFDGKYEDWVAQNTQTQFMSFNIGTAESPRYVQAIQPVIRFDATTGIQQYNPEAFNVVVDDDVEVNNIETQKANIERRRQEELEIHKLSTPKTISQINAKYDAELAALERATSDTISNSEYNEFIDKGIVSQERLNSIVEKVKQGIQLEGRELEMFNDKVREINEILKASQEVKPEPPKVEIKLGRRKINIEKIASVDDTTGVVELPISGSTERSETSKDTPSEVDSVIANNISDGEVAQIASEEGISESEVVGKVKEEVERDLKENGLEINRKPKTTLQKVVARIKKALLTLLIATSSYTGIFSMNISQDTDMQYISTENLKRNTVANIDKVLSTLPETYQQFAYRGLDKLGLIQIEEESLKLPEIELAQTASQKFIDYALSFKGVKESGDQSSPSYGSQNLGFTDSTFERLMYENGFKKGYAWCSIYLKLVLNQVSGLENRMVINDLFTPSVNVTFNNIKKANNPNFKIVDPSEIEAGSIVFYSNESRTAGHILMVTKVNQDGTFETIEGNTNEAGEREGYKVDSRTRTLNEEGLPLLGVVNINYSGLTSNNTNFYTEHSKVKDDSKGTSKSDSLIVFQRQVQNSDGLTYIPAPSKENTKGDESFSGVTGVAHFLITQGEDLTSKTSDSQLRKAKDKVLKQYQNQNPLGWVPTFEKHSSGAVTMRFKKLDQVEDSDIVITRLYQRKFGHLDFSASKRASSGVGGKLAVMDTVRNQGVDQLQFTTPSAYGRISGGSAFFIFEANGQTITQEVAGSVEFIQKVGESIISQYNIDPNELTIGFFDAGSYAAKPAAIDGVVSTQRYSGYNNSKKSGAALLLPSEGFIQFSEQDKETFKEKVGETFEEYVNRVGQYTSPEDLAGQILKAICG